MALFKHNPLPLKEFEEKQHPWARTFKDVYSHRMKHAHNSMRNPKYTVKEEKKPDPKRIRFTVIGDRVTKEFIYCTNLVKGLYKYRWKNFDVPFIRGCSTIEWPEVLHGLKLRFGGTAYCLSSSVAVLVEDKLIGGEKELQQMVETKLFYYLCLDYYNEGVAEFARYVRSTSRPFVYMHVSIDDKHIGTLIYMLYADIVPYTCENFLRLCKETRGGYGGTPVHRIVQDGWIQCGGFGLKSTPLPCENFIVPFDRRGVLAMANDGRDVDCSTQFFVLLQPSLWMNHKYVAFGQLVEGAATLKEIERVTTWYESPTSKIILYRCGILNMECHDIMINRGANEYIDGHVEDLNTLAEIIWEDLLEKTFLQAQMRELERMRALEGEGADASPQHGEPMANIPAKKTHENFEFDVEEMEAKYEEEESSYNHQSLHPSSLVEKPQRPYYIPLTDVPYPGDVESDFDLQKFLKGNYCLESDLSNKKGEVAVFPSALWAECRSESSSSKLEELSLDSEEQEEIVRYLKENVDRVSFAGGVVKKIPQETRTAENVKRDAQILTDEKLRKVRLASADFIRRKKHKTRVSVAAPGVHKPEGRPPIKRRQTGFIQPADLAKLFHLDLDDDDEKDDSDDDEQSGQQNARGGPARKPLQRRPTAFVKSIRDDDDDDDDDFEEMASKQKESVLVRLYDEVDVDSEVGPTLKNYIPTAERQHKNLLKVTHYTPLFQAVESREQYKRHSVSSSPRGSLDHVLQLRHGRRISRKISTDYVKTMEVNMNAPRSIRTVEYAKKRPTISVSDYKLQNLRYKEQLKREADLASWWVYFIIFLFYRLLATCHGFARVYTYLFSSNKYSLCYSR